MYEYVLWSNCGNHCKFCWQKNKNDNTTFLTVEEKSSVLQALRNEVKKLPYCDLLIVGGEVFEFNSFQEYMILHELADFLFGLLISDKIRFLYLNTNLLYKRLEGVGAFLTKVATTPHLFNKIKFTTSFDIYGRFKNDNDKNLFLSNLDTLTYSFTNLHVIVNMILTKQFCVSQFNLKEFCTRYRVGFHLIPYITLHEEMRPKLTDIIECFSFVENMYPGYAKENAMNYDLKQEKYLFEYNKVDGFTNQIAPFNSCGHNNNFTRVLKDNSCYICVMKDLYC
jgi:hypothetical protein